MPASCAIRSSSAGHTNRKGTEKRSSVSVDHLEVMGDEPLGPRRRTRRSPRRSAAGEDVEGLAGREPPELRDHHLDDEAAAWLEVRGRVPEARDLVGLRRQVHDRVEHEVDERERPVDRGRREVADRHVDRVAAGLGRQSGPPSPSRARSPAPGPRAQRAAARCGRSRSRTRAPARRRPAPRGHRPSDRRPPAQIGRQRPRRTSPRPARRSTRRCSRSDPNADDGVSRSAAVCRER